MYPAALVGSLVFYWAYREWLSWILLLCVVILPVFSLLFSLWPIRKTKVGIRCPDAVRPGQRVCVQLQAEGPLPVPPVRGHVAVTGTLFPGKWKLRPGEVLPTAHCGALRIDPRQLRLCDYLGLFRLRPGTCEPGLLLVRPEQMPVEPPDVSRFVASAFRPKPGGGFSENHELRPYRPGDSLHRIHWKLTAKTGKLMIREPMEAIREQIVLSLALTGGPEVLDRKLGQLLWLSRYLLSYDLSHLIYCAAGGGTELLAVSDEASLQKAVDTLLQCSPAESPVLPDFSGASWHYRIGGDGLEP